MGEYSDALRDGYEILARRTLDTVVDPEECWQRCTHGFHYAYDSASTGTSEDLLMVCSDKKCLGKKRAAFTREKNAAGNAMKRAEKAAIQKAVEATRELDRPRLDLIVWHQIMHSDQYYCATASQPVHYWLNKLAIPKEKSQGQTNVRP